MVRTTSLLSRTEWSLRVQFFGVRRALLALHGMSNVTKVADSDGSATW